MFNPPPDLDESDLMACLAESWSIRAETLTYRPVGFGSHHWLAREGERAWFVTIDDLRTCLISAKDTPDAVAERLSRAFESARRLADSGLSFVVGPLPSTDDRPAVRLGRFFSVVVHPYLVGEPAGKNGAYQDPRRRLVMSEHLVALHAATPLVAGVALADDLAVPLRDELEVVLTQLDTKWDGGPYSEPTRKLLQDDAAGAVRLLGLYDQLVVRAADPARTVITHGEPHAGNVIVTAEGLKLVDWESARLALPERDLWDLDSGDGSVLHSYQQLSGRPLDQAALALYRLWYDLFEIAGYVSGFRGPHADNEDSAESWKNLRYFLRPEERWPEPRWAHL